MTMEGSKRRMAKEKGTERRKRGEQDKKRGRPCAEETSRILLKSLKKRKAVKPPTRQKLD